jgi:hypothetical protein
MHVLSALEQLLHIQLDLARLQLDSFILQETSKVMVHIRKDHVNR